jgi:hypothetical protein
VRIARSSISSEDLNLYCKKSMVEVDVQWILSRETNLYVSRCRFCEDISVFVKLELPSSFELIRALVYYTPEYSLSVKSAGISPCFPSFIHRK